MRFCKNGRKSITDEPFSILNGINSTHNPVYQRSILRPISLALKYSGHSYLE